MGRRGSQACEALGRNHQKHIRAYGEGNERRLTGKHETNSIDSFKCPGPALRVRACVRASERAYCILHNSCFITSYTLLYEGRASTGRGLLCPTRAACASWRAVLCRAAGRAAWLC